MFWYRRIQQCQGTGTSICILLCEMQNEKFDWNMRGAESKYLPLLSRLLLSLGCAENRSFLEKLIQSVEGKLVVS